MVTRLEEREVPALYAVGLLSPAAGDVGQSSATFAGGIALNSTLPTQNGKALVDAATPTAAIQAALVNTITATVGTQSANYSAGAGTIGSTTAAQTPFVVTPTATAGQFTLRLEDLAAMPGMPSDWDYDDRSWLIGVEPVPPASLTTVSGVIWVELTEDGVRQDIEPRSVGIPVKLFKADGTFVAETNTNQDGEYTFNGAPLGVGLYVEFPTPTSGFKYTAPNVGADTTRDSDASLTTYRTATFTVVADQNKTGLDAGWIRTYGGLAVGTTFGPGTVPGNSKYRYVAAVAGDQTGGGYGWTISDPNAATLVAGPGTYHAGTNRTTFPVELSFKNDAPAKPILKLIKTATHEVMATQTIVVVQVIVTDLPTNTFKAAKLDAASVTDLTDGPATIEMGGMGVRGSHADTPDGTTSGAKVTLVGPGNNEGVDKIRVGIIQRAKTTLWSGRYGPNKWVNASAISNEYVLDIDPALAYNPLVAFGRPYQITYADTSKRYGMYPAPNAPAVQGEITLGSLDRPQLGVPLTWQKQSKQQLTAGLAAGTTYDWLTYAQMQIEFKVDVAVQALVPTDFADRYYWSQASADWRYGAVGPVTMNTSVIEDGLPKLTFSPLTTTTDVPAGWTIGPVIPTAVPIIGPTASTRVSAPNLTFTAFTAP